MWVSERRICQVPGRNRSTRRYHPRGPRRRRTACGRQDRAGTAIPQLRLPPRRRAAERRWLAGQRWSRRTPVEPGGAGVGVPAVWWTLFELRGECRNAKNKTCLPARISRADCCAGPDGPERRGPGREFEPCSHTIRKWLRLAGVCERGSTVVPVDPLTDEERDELRRLRKEVHRLRQERDILSKAAAWFATNDVTSPRSTGS